MKSLNGQIERFLRENMPTKKYDGPRLPKAELNTRLKNEVCSMLGLDPTMISRLDWEYQNGEYSMAMTVPASPTNAPDLLVIFQIAMLFGVANPQNVLISPVPTGLGLAFCPATAVMDKIVEILDTPGVPADPGAPKNSPFQVTDLSTSSLDAYAALGAKGKIVN